MSRSFYPFYLTRALSLHLASAVLLDLPMALLPADAAKAASPNSITTALLEPRPAQWWHYSIVRGDT